MSNTIEIHVKHGYTFHFYQLEEDVYLELINREGVIVNNLPLSLETREAISRLMGVDSNHSSSNSRGII